MIKPWAKGVRKLVVYYRDGRMEEVTGDEVERFAERFDAAEAVRDNVAQPSSPRTGRR